MRLLNTCLPSCPNNPLMCPCYHFLSFSYCLIFKWDWKPSEFRNNVKEILSPKWGKNDWRFRKNNLSFFAITIYIVQLLSYSSLYNKQKQLIKNHKKIETHEILLSQTHFIYNCYTAFWKSKMVLNTILSCGFVEWVPNTCIKSVCVYICGIIYVSVCVCVYLSCRFFFLEIFVYFTKL